MMRAIGLYAAQSRAAIRTSFSDRGNFAIQVGGMIAGTSVGVGVGSPTSIWPKEQARLVDNNKMARTPSAARFTDLEASFIVGWWAMDAVDDGRVPA